MPVASHLDSIAALAEQSRTKELFSFALRDFLDGFRANPTPSTLLDEPVLLTPVLHDNGYADAFLAALAEHLARQSGWSPPLWCKNPGRYLKEPHFAYKTPEGRMFLLVESPTAFRVRNIFISADSLTRV